MLRLATLDDAPAIAEIYRPFVEESVISFELVPPDADEMGQRMANTLKTLPWLVREVDDAVVAYAYAGYHRVRPAYQWSVDVTIYSSPVARRRGIGRELYAATFRILEAQGYRRAHAGITLPNDASVAFHEAMGFEPIGVYPEVGYKNGRWHDVGWWTRPLLPRVQDPPAPIPLPLLTNLPIGTEV